MWAGPGPSLEIDQIVLEGAYERTLAFGSEHVESTRPLEGSGSIILTGHRDTHFRFLEKLESGDVLALQARRGMWMRFTVQDCQIVDARTATISTQKDKRQLSSLPATRSLPSFREDRYGIWSSQRR
jgi:sortase A